MNKKGWGRRHRPKKETIYLLVICLIVRNSGAVVWGADSTLFCSSEAPEPNWGINAEEDRDVFEDTQEDVQIPQEDETFLPGEGEDGNGSGNVNDVGDGGETGNGNCCGNGMESGNGSGGLKEPNGNVPDKVSGNLFSDGTEQEDADPASGYPAKTGEDDNSGNSGQGVSSSGGENIGGYLSGSSQGSSKSEKIHRQPKFTLESSSLAEQPLMAGQEAELTAVFRNMSRSEAAYNMKVTLKPSDDSVALAASSFYFTKVSAQETITLSTAVQAALKAEPKKTAVTAAFEYENVKGETYTSEETVMIEVYQPVHAGIEDFHFEDMVYSQETITTKLRICNTGRTEIYNVKAELEGQGLFAVETVFAGTIEAGAFYDGSVKVYVGTRNMTASGVNSIDEGETKGSAYGETSGTLKLIYEDAYGQEYTEISEFTTIIMKPRVIELKAEKEEKGTNQWWAVSIAAMALLFTAILAGMGLKLRKRQNQIADLLAIQREKHEL